MPALMPAKDTRSTGGTGSKESAESFAKAQKRNAKDPFTLFYRGKSLLHNERWEEGIGIFDKRIAIEEKNAAALVL